jgi:hypothetical protein
MQGAKNERPIADKVGCSDDTNKNMQTSSVGAKLWASRRKFAAPFRSGYRAGASCAKQGMSCFQAKPVSST